MDCLFLSVVVIISVLVGFGTFRYLQKRRKKNLKNIEKFIKEREDHSLALCELNSEIKRFGDSLNGVGKATADPFKAMAQSITASVRPSRKVESSEYHGYSDHTHRSSSSRATQQNNDGFGIGLTVGVFNSHSHSGSSHSSCSGNSSGSSDSGSSGSSDSGSCGGGGGD